MVTHEEILNNYINALRNITTEEKKYMSQHVYQILCDTLQSIDHDLEALKK